MSTICIYHSADFDGIFCREIAKRFLPPDTLFIGWNYGDEVPPVTDDDDLYILDLSIDELMGHPRLTWIDHHKTAIDKYPAGIAGYRIDGVAACRLAWQWFEEGADKLNLYRPDKLAFIDRRVREPLAVRLAGEYDIWDKRDFRSELFQHGLRSQDLNEHTWDLLLTNEDNGPYAGNITVTRLLDAGQAIQYAKSKENASIITANGFTVAWEGLRFLACNAGQYNSLLFTAGIKPEHDALMGFCLRANGKWSVSLYGVPHRPDVDLSAIAAKYGGGGHRQACGFTTEKLPFL